jgi:4-hydroxybenzoate polyprenyltransferase
MVLAFIRLLRPVNLILIAFTMWAMRHLVIAPMLAVRNFEFTDSEGLFVLLILASVFIAAAGNVINDYFDIKADVLNRPNQVIVGTIIDKRVAMSAHLILNFLGLACAVIYGWKTGTLKFVSIHGFAIVTLWFYSSYFKRHLLLGNLLVALLTALVPLTVGIAIVPQLVSKYSLELQNVFKGTDYSSSFYFQVMFIWIAAFAFFAFFTNFIREIQKDMADMKGDRAVYRKTLPLVYGVKVASRTVVALMLVWLGLLFYGQQKYLGDDFSFAYFLLFLAFPMIISGIITLKGGEPKRYTLAANITKGVMLVGILFSFLIEKIMFS